jgi:hypothetical protein
MNARSADADEEMLSPADDFVHPLPGEVDGGVAGHPNIAARQRLSLQRLAQPDSGVEDGVTFGHRYPAIRSDTSHSRSAFAVSTA